MADRTTLVPHAARARVDAAAAAGVPHAAAPGTCLFARRAAR